MAISRADELRQLITDEFLIALNFPTGGIVRRLLDPILSIPTGRFSRLAAEADERVAQSGTAAAMRWFLSHYLNAVELHGVENIPNEGPLLLASNHPGAYDGVAILANSPRNDIHLIVSDVPFTHAFPHFAPHLIYATADTHGRMAAIRSMIRHLQNGEAVMLFPTGRVDPDPNLQAGSEQSLQNWSPSLNIMLRQVPQTQLVATFVSGVLSSAFLRNPIVRLAGEEWRRRKLAEFLQIGFQLLLSAKLPLMPSLSFGSPISGFELMQRSHERNLMPAIIEYAQSVLKAHLNMQTYFSYKPLD